MKPAAIMKLPRLSVTPLRGGAAVLMSETALAATNAKAYLVWDQGFGMRFAVLTRPRFSGE